MAGPKKKTVPKDEPKRRKSDGERKDDVIRVRVTAEQKELLTAAATRAGSDVSTWLRMLGIREAQRE